MPPKSAQKTKAEPAKEARVTPQPKSNAEPQKSDQPKPKQPPKQASPKKPKAPTVFTPLAKGSNAAVPVDVSFTGDSKLASVKKNGGFTHVVKLDAAASFMLVETRVFTEGPLEGFQAIIIRPEKAFPFLNLPKDVRARVYRWFFAPKGVSGGGIPVEGKRANKDVYAKGYADGSKNRVALLAIHAEAIQIFYANTIKLESTTTLLDFLSQAPPSVRPRLTHLSIKSFTKTTSRLTMQFLSEACNLQRLTFETGVFGERDTIKAAKFFDTEARKFLLAMGSAKGSADAGVDVLEFGPAALTYKDDKKVTKNWPPAEVEEFKNKLRAKLKDT